MTAKDTFGTRDDGDGLVFCLYDAGGLVARATIPGGGGLPFLDQSDTTLKDRAD